MTALEFMEKQLRKCQYNFCKEVERDPASEAASNLRRKCQYYEEAIEALRKVATDFPTITEQTKKALEAMGKKAHGG